MVKEPLTQREKLEVFQREVQERRRGQPWYVTAQHLDDALADGGLGYGEDVIKKLAQEASGLSRGVLVRYVSTIRRVKAAAMAAGVPVQSLLSPGFNAVEAAARLYERSASEGLEAFKGLAEERLALRHVQRMISESFSAEEGSFDARSRTLRRRGLELKSIDAALEGLVLEGSALELFPKDSFVQRRPHMPYFRHIGWEIRGRDGICLCGIDAVASHSDDASSYAEEILPSSALLSVYFPKYFFAFSPNSPQRAEDETIAALELLELPWIGVLRVKSDLSIEVTRDPEGSPVPNRSSEYESLRAGLKPRARSS